MGSSPTYPKRPRFFAHKFCRVLAKACIANELGADVCWLLSVLAHTEDAGGYRKPVTFHNGQLIAFCGFGSESKLKRAREKAVRSGWLHYLPGHRGAAARYWVVLPDNYRGMDDFPSDERPEKFADADGTTDTNGSAGDPQSGLQPGAVTTAGRPTLTTASIGSTGDTTSGLNPDSVRSQSGLGSDSDRSTLFPVPVPRPEPRQTDPQTPAVGRPAEPGSYDPLTADQDARRLFVDRWNSSGLRRLSRLTHGLHSRLAALLLDPWWAEHYPAALERAGKIPFLAAGAGRQKGPLDPSEFLRGDDFVRQVLDGVFDPREPSATGPPHARTARDRRVDDVFAEYEAKVAREGECPGTGS